MQVTELTDNVSNLSVQVDKQEQYSRRNCLLLLGVEKIEMKTLIPFQLALLISTLG